MFPAVDVDGFNLSPGGLTAATDLPSARTDGWQCLTPPIVSHSPGHPSLWTRFIEDVPALLLRLVLDAPLEFIIFPQQKTVRAFWNSPECRWDDVISTFRGPGLGVALRHCGHVLLHAGAVEVGDAAMLVLGGSGAGKSTLLASLARQNLPLVCDDMALLVTRAKERPLLQAHRTGLKLWPDSVAALGWSATDWPSVHALTEKRQLSLGLSIERAAMPIGALVVLATASPDKAGTIQRLNPARSLPLLLEQQYPPFLPVGRTERPHWFSDLTSLVDRVPVYLARRPGSFGGLKEFCAEIGRLPLAI